MGLGGNQLCIQRAGKAPLPRSPSIPSPSPSSNGEGGKLSSAIHRGGEMDVCMCVCVCVELCGRISRKNGWASRLSDNHHHRPVCYYIHRFIIVFLSLYLLYFLSFFLSFFFFFFFIYVFISLLHFFPHSFRDFFSFYFFSFIVIIINTKY